MLENTKMIKIQQKLYRAVDKSGNQISEWTTSFDAASEMADCENTDRQPCSVESVYLDSILEKKLEHTCEMEG